MFALPPVETAIPLGGSAVLFAFMVRQLWTARSDWVIEKATMKKDWADEKAALIAYSEEALVRMQTSCAATTDTLRRLHLDELASLNRRIDNLEAEIARGKT